MSLSYKSLEDQKRVAQKSKTKVALPSAATTATTYDVQNKTTQKYVSSIPQQNQVESELSKVPSKLIFVNGLTEFANSGQAQSLPPADRVR